MDLKYKSPCILEYVFMLLNEFGLPPLYLILLCTGEKDETTTRNCEKGEGDLRQNCCPRLCSKLPRRSGAYCVWDTVRQWLLL